MSLEITIVRVRTAPWTVQDVDGVHARLKVVLGVQIDAEENALQVVFSVDKGIGMNDSAILLRPFRTVVQSPCLSKRLVGFNRKFGQVHPRQPSQGR